MQRREFIWKSTVLGAVAVTDRSSRLGSGALAKGEDEDKSALSVSNPLNPPKAGKIAVAFVISRGAVMIDFAGPWEVFQDAWVASRPGDQQTPFSLYTVAESMAPVKTSGGMLIAPNFTFANAPTPKIVVIPAQQGASDAMLNWIRASSKQADVTMSVCTGAFILAQTGLLAGKAATTHHGSYRAFALRFPDIQLKRGARFVESGNLATSGGLSSGIDLALRIVERYFGRKAALDAAYYMEYQGRGWTDARSNSIYARAMVSTPQHPLCPVCAMEVDPKTAPNSTYKGQTYYFCSTSHKKTFDVAPEKWI